MRLIVTQFLFVLSWLYWLSSIAGIVFAVWYILTQEKIEAMPIAQEPWFSYLPLMLLSVVVIEILISLALKKYALVIPSKKHKYDSNDCLGALLFFIVHLVNYTLATSIAVYGIVLYVYASEYVYLSVGLGVWASLMIYHLPFKIHKPLVRTA